MIPRTIHVVWIGDESLRPEKAIGSWREKNPRWNVVLYGNRDLESRKWRHARWMEHYWNKGWLCGAADVMRWQLLEEQGGFAIDADAPCLRPLEDWLFEGPFACWENERIRPGMVNNGFVAAPPNDPLIQGINSSLEEEELSDLPPWRMTGPLRMTAAWKAVGQHWTIWPSHFFMPSHFAGARYTGNSWVFAEQKWGSTVGYEGIE